MACIYGMLAEGCLLWFTVTYFLIIDNGVIIHSNEKGKHQHIDRVTPRVLEQFSLCFVLLIGVTELLFHSISRQYHQTWLCYDSQFLMRYFNLFEREFPSQSFTNGGRTVFQDNIFNYDSWGRNVLGHGNSWTTKFYKLWLRFMLHTLVCIFSQILNSSL